MFDLTIDFDQPDGLAVFGEALGRAGISDQAAAAAAARAWNQEPSGR